MDHGHEGMGINCEGVGRHGEGGTMMGHILPGTLFVVWGSWWAYNVCLRCAVMSHNKIAFQSSAWYKFPTQLKGGRMIEPILKILLPLIALSMELYLDHLSEGFQRLYCPKGTMHEGEFAGDNVNNWQHASSYPAVIASGVVDILAYTVVPLPPGVQRAFSALWIGIMSFLMFVHEKHEVLDKMVHWLLAVAMFIGFFFQSLEMYAPSSPIVSLGKATSTLFVGAWLIQIGRILYSGAPQWTHSRGTGAMLAPVFFCMIFLMICISVLVLYMVLSYFQKRNALPRCMLSTVTEEEEHGGLLPQHHSRHTMKHKSSMYTEMADMVHLLPTERSFDSDSAHHHSGSDLN